MDKQQRTPTNSGSSTGVKQRLGVASARGRGRGMGVRGRGRGRGGSQAQSMGAGTSRPGSQLKTIRYSIIIILGEEIPLPVSLILWLLQRYQGSSKGAWSRWAWQISRRWLTGSSSFISTSRATVPRHKDPTEGAWSRWPWEGTETTRIGNSFRLYKHPTDSRSRPRRGMYYTMAKYSSSYSTEESLSTERGIRICCMILLDSQLEIINNDLSLLYNILNREILQSYYSSLGYLLLCSLNRLV